jgi:hypothetical protein
LVGGKPQTALEFPDARDAALGLLLLLGALVFLVLGDNHLIGLVLKGEEETLSWREKREKSKQKTNFNLV